MKIINDFLKKKYCDKGNHKFREVWNDKGNYQSAKCVCSICGEKREFTRMEMWAISRGLPFKHTKWYDLNEKITDFLTGALVNIILFVSILFAILACVAPVLAVIWFVKHW